MSLDDVSAIVKDDGFTLVGPVAYRGKEGCESVTCTRRPELTTHCYGWHCSYCDAPCSYQGHNCDAAQAILGEARRALKENS